MGAYNHTNLLAPQPPKKDIPREPSTSLGAEHWLPMFEGADVCTYSNSGLSCSNISQIYYICLNMPMFEQEACVRVRSTQTLVEIYNA